MRKNETKPISIVFLVFIVVMIIIIILYATAPKTGNKENNEDINNNLITTETTQTRQEKDSVYIKSDMVKTGVHSETKNKEQYDTCINNKNGDLTLFWSHFEQTYKDFYTNRAVSQSTLKSLVNILGDAKKEVVNRGISDKQVAEALEYRVRTLLSNISHPGNQTNIRKTALSYLKFIKEKKENPKSKNRA